MDFVPEGSDPGVTYSVKEIFLTLQGEGGQAGRAAVFCRFSGCNLWSGREQDRASAVCTFCDTDFVGTDGPGGGKFTTADDLADAVARAWTGDGDNRLVVCTGGEPLLQLDPALILALKTRGFDIAVETNGTLKAPDGSASAQRPMHLSSRRAVRNSSWSIPRSGSIRRVSRVWISSVSTFSRWMDRIANRLPSRRLLIV